ncbi:Neisseria PilC protein [compost metagenome]
MKTYPLFKDVSVLLMALAIFAPAHAAVTDISTTPLNTYSAPTSTDVKPNVFFILDDSGSMDWDFMPDWACSGTYSTSTSSCNSAGQDPSSARTEYWFKNAAYNGMYYNPGVRYIPPVAVGATGAISTTTYLSQTGVSAATGGNGSASAVAPNWAAVKNDAYGVQSSGTTDLQGSTSTPPYFYTMVVAEYCTAPNLKTCVSATAPSTTHPYPASVRWCTDSGLGTCRATYGTGYTWVRAPSPPSTTISVSGSTNTIVSSILVGGLEILSAPTNSSNNANTVAQAIANNINLCTINRPTGTQCTVVGYSATRSGSTVTILAPASTTATPAITKTGMNVTTSAFSVPSTSILGENRRITLIAGINSYPYPGSTSKAIARTDCVGTTCTYNEEMTNYANWWTYYRTRMQMMKTAASNAFATIDAATDIASNVSRFRLGYMSINNNTNSDYLNLGEFAGTQKYNWYNKLISANPSNGTALRSTLATAGRLYAGKLNGNSYRGSTVADPMQYSCQQNYTILSTDGFWNGDAGYKLDGSTGVANQDVGLGAPYSDGGTPQLQSQTSTLQQRTGRLQISVYSRSSWSDWANASTCSANNTTQCRYNWANTWTNVASCSVNYSSGNGSWTISSGTDCRYSDSSWANATSCTPVTKSISPTYTVGTARACRTISSSGGTSDTLADVAAYYYNTDLRNSDATGADATGTCAGPVIAPSTIANNLCDNNVPANGRDVATAQHMTTFTLGLGAQGQMTYAPTDGKDYWNDTSGDFYDVKSGTTANPANGTCSWQSSGACTWPIPASNSNANIDDLWHAAINGHGAYFSASDPASLSSSLISALTTIVNTPRPGTAAAAASSNPNVSASDNYVFSSSYKSVEWYGELIRQQITPEGTLTAQNWSAMRLLDCATTVWTASTSYVVGRAFRQGNRCYTVNNAYVSGATFNAAGIEDANTSVVNADETATTRQPVVPLTSRNIYIKGATGLVSFEWANLTAAQKAYFSAPAITYASATVGLSQFCSPAGGACLSNALQTNNTIASGGAAGEALVNFLRGDRSHEGGYYRQRTHVLGDIVSSEARYVQTPMFNYLDLNYSAFKSDKSTRAGAVYVGANDGMLHAFDATTGQELWAYIPSMVLPNLYKLADKNYPTDATKHQFYVDNSPETADICPTAPTSTCSAAQWKTILVGGLNRGGKGYYALDITNPAAPAVLWEFTDQNLGYTYGNPTITKLKDGTWVVLLSSGYNNIDGTVSTDVGKGRLYVLNAATGEVIRNIATAAGSLGTPSGLSRISAHVLQSSTDSTAIAAYGGDTLGNLWRFDINNDIGAAGYDAQLLVSLADAAGRVQPITIKPVQATISGKPVIYVGAGRYLGTTDVADNSTQSFYAIKDNLDAVTLGNPRTGSSNFVAQTLTSGVCPEGTPSTVCIAQQEVRTSSSNVVDWNTKNGWYLDFLTGGERVSTDPSLSLGTLLFTTITPQASTVSACGPTTGTAASFVYALDYLTGGAVGGANGVVGISLGSGLVTRPVMILQADGTVRALIRTSSGVSSGSDLGGTIVITPPIKPPSASGTRRVSWRVLNTP